MVSSVLDNKDTHILGFPLTIAQQIWISYLLPTIIYNLVYVFDISTDLAIGIELIRERRLIAGLCTLIITFTPSLCLLFMRLSKPPKPPTFSVIFKWIIIEFTAFILYPLRPLFCFAERLFWSIEALRLRDPDREEALLQYEKTENRMMESYLFVQGLLQAGPQAVFQLTLLILRHSGNEHTEDMQALCFISSLTTLSIIIARYHRYESQANGKRKRVLGNSPPDIQDVVDCSESATRGIRLPVRSNWIKAMSEDTSPGKVVLFIFWFNFLLGRILCLSIATYFYPLLVIGVCAAHYLLFFLYILPSPKFTSSFFNKIILAFIFIFCLIEVGIKFAKPGILYTLFYLVTVGENLGLTLFWVLLGNWKTDETTTYWYKYALCVICIVHVISFTFLIIYIVYFRPKVMRIRPLSQQMAQEERPLSESNMPQSSTLQETDIY